MHFPSGVILACLLELASIGRGRCNKWKRSGFSRGAHLFAERKGAREHEHKADNQPIVLNCFRATETNIFTFVYRSD
jgi:hypothetical protein